MGKAKSFHFELEHESGGTPIAMGLVMDEAEGERTSHQSDRPPGFRVLEKSGQTVRQESPEQHLLAKGNRRPGQHQHSEQQSQIAVQRIVLTLI